MYSIWADGVCIHNDLYFSKEHQVVSPKLTLSDNAAGSLAMTLPPSNIGYETVRRLSSEITVKRDNIEIWSGRVIDEKQGFHNSRVLTCEGELGYLNDTIQPPAEYHDVTVRGFLSTLIGIHNQKSDKKFEVGAVTVTDSNDSLYRYTNYESTLECIREKLVNRLGGHIRIRKVGSVRYIDYLADWANTNTQIIRFGVNLLDFTRTWDMTKLATVILPRGKRLEESEIDALEAYTTVESVNGGSIYVQSETAVEQYGWIAKVVDWDDVGVPSNLLRKAQLYLQDVQFENLVLELTAVDLHYLNADAEPINLLDRIRCVSVPHGMDRYFPVTKLEIPLDKPEETTYILGTEEKTSLTSASSHSASEIRQTIELIPSKQSILKEASENATALIRQAVNGYITIVNGENNSEELIISDTSDYTQATRLWRWNINGLGYSRNGGRTYSLAMTMDGAIVADFITTGTLNADLIRTGTLNADLIRTGTIHSPDYNSTWDLNSGILTTKMWIDSSYTDDGERALREPGYQIIELDSGGLFLSWDNGFYERKVGSSSLLIDIDDESLKGWGFDLEFDGDYICWSAQNSRDGTYWYKMIYCRDSMSDGNGGYYRADTISFDCDIDLRHCCIRNAILVNCRTEDE